jgi:hypothetical protein
MEHVAFMFDDQFDDGPVGRNPGQSNWPLDELLAILACDPGESVQPTFPLANALAELWTTVSESMPGEWCERFRPVSASR